MPVMQITRSQEVHLKCKWLSGFFLITYFVIEFSVITGWRISCWLKIFKVRYMVARSQFLPSFDLISFSESATSLCKRTFRMFFLLVVMFSFLSDKISRAFIVFATVLQKYNKFQSDLGLMKFEIYPDSNKSWNKRNVIWWPRLISS